ncbi:MAG: PAS domain S-box protein, partial [bacterium]|nr:PAS domain S-box protein [bacterium]
MVEQALRISEERYRFLMEESQQPLVVLRGFEFAYANPAAANLLGYSDTQSLLAVGLDGIVPLEDRAARRLSVQMRAEGQEADQQYEGRFLRHDGRIIWCEVNTTIGDFEGSVAVLTSLHDITDRRLTASKLARSNSVLRATLESTADGILVADGSGLISAYNEKFLEMWDIAQQQVHEHFHLDLLASVAEQLKGGVELLAITKQIYLQPASNSFDLLEFEDGRVFERFSQPQRVAGECVGRVWSFRDITERRRAEDMRAQLEGQLRQAQKMEAIGT